MHAEHRFVDIVGAHDHLVVAEAHACRAWWRIWCCAVHRKVLAPSGSGTCPWSSCRSARGSRREITMNCHTSWSSWPAKRTPTHLDGSHLGGASRCIDAPDRPFGCGCTGTGARRRRTPCALGGCYGTCVVLMLGLVVRRRCWWSHWVVCSWVRQRCRRWPWSGRVVAECRCSPMWRGYRLG